MNGHGVSGRARGPISWWSNHSTIREVFGKLKEGAAYGYTKVLGYHRIPPPGPTPARSSMPGCARDRPTPLVGPSASSKSSSPACAEPVRPGGSSCASTRATGPMRPSRCSPAWRSPTPWPCARASHRPRHRRDPRVELVSIEYPAGGEAMVAETTYKGRRLIVRRTRLVGPQASLWPNWRHFAFLSDLAAARWSRRFPPPSRRRRAVHRRLEGGCGHGALPFW